MKVIGGTLKGLNIAETKSRSTHPMSTKIRNALFNSLGELRGLRIVDCYSGTGALALEAISRGAASVVAIEKDHRIYHVMRMNVRNSGVADQIQTICANCLTWIDNLKYEPFDVAIADPPFRSLNDKVISTVARCLKPGGILILSHARKSSIEVPLDCQWISTRNYGQAALSILRRSI